MRWLFTISLFASYISWSQQKDALLWTGVGLDLGINKKIELEYETQVRLDQNMSRFIQYYNEVGIEYDIAKGFRTSATYRYSRKNDGDYYFNENRIVLDASWRYKTEFGLSFKTRSRFQHTFDRLRPVNNIYPDRKNVLRVVFDFDYEHPDFKRIQPFFATEFFYALSPKNTTTSFLDTYRFKAGFTLDLPDRHAFKVFYMYEHENRESDNLNHIYCVEYNYSFKSLHKRKKDKKKSD